MDSFGKNNDCICVCLALHNRDFSSRYKYCSRLNDGWIEIFQVCAPLLE
jgi:hypothetical protein